ncbi:hypothetical protein KI387_005938, partial [Taxus chinensis]
AESKKKTVSCRDLCEQQLLLAHAKACKIHQQLVYDNMLFAFRTLQEIKDALELYEKASGKKVNKGKSIFRSPHLQSAAVKVLSRKLGIVKEDFPNNYL